MSFNFMKLENVLMKTMFKKTLVAAALAGFGFAAQAATVGTTVVNISKQGAVTGDLKASAVVVTVEAAYAVGDTVTFTFTGGLKAAPLTITSTGGQNAVTLGRTGLSATKATYRVTEISGAGADHGVFTFTDSTPLTADAETAFVFKAADVVTLGKVSAVFAATLGNSTSPLDAPVVYNDPDDELTSGDLFSVRDQFAATITSANRFNGVLDVAEDREKFTDGGTTDMLTIGLTNRADLGAVTKGATTFKVNGDFSWAADASVATPGCANGAVVGTPSITANSYTFVCNAASTGATLELNIAQGDDTVPVSPTSFTLDVSHAYGAATAALSQGPLSAGAWTVNGATVTIPYMAYGTIGTKTFSQIINLTNNGSQSGSVYADVWATDASGKSSPVLSNVVVGTTNPKATLKLAGVLKTAMEAKGFKDGTVAIRLLADVKADSVSVYSAYVDNATTERAIVNNDSPVVATKVVAPVEVMNNLN
ncbi:MAG: hypothetical protein ACK4XG_08600 [Chromatiaceae bacterium]